MFGGGRGEGGAAAECQGEGEGQVAHCSIMEPNEASWGCWERTDLAVCQAGCPFPGNEKCTRPGCPWRCNGCSAARPRDAAGFHLDKQFLWTVLCNRVKYLGVAAGWVLPGMAGWVNANQQYVEWVYALGERVDWLRQSFDEVTGEWLPEGRECRSTTALPQQFPAAAVVPVVPVPPAPPSWVTTEGSGQVNRVVKPYRKPPQADQSRGGRRYA